MTPAEFELALEGYNEHFELQQQLEYERARTVAFFAVSPYQKKGSNLSPEKIWPLPWDKKKLQQITTNARIGSDPKVLERLRAIQAQNMKKNG